MKKNRLKTLIFVFVLATMVCETVAVCEKPKVEKPKVYPTDYYEKSGGVYSYNKSTGVIGSGTVNGTTYGTLDGKKTWYTYPAKYTTFFENGTFAVNRWIKKSKKWSRISEGTWAMGSISGGIVIQVIRTSGDGKKWKEVKNPKQDYRYEKPD